MLIDANECPLCGGRKTDGAFCEVCRDEIDSVPNYPAFRRLAAINIMYRNNRPGHYFSKAKKQAAARLDKSDDKTP